MWSEILEKIDKGEPVNWDRLSQRQTVQLLAMSEQYRKEAEERSRQADLLVERMLNDANTKTSEQ